MANDGGVAGVLALPRLGVASVSALPMVTDDGAAALQARGDCC